MTEMTLKAESRSEIKGGNPKRMLKEDILPGVVYGSGIENINIKLNYQEFLKVFNIAGESKVVNLTIGDETKKVFIHKIQKNPITNKITHVDFYQFNKNKKFSVEVPINFVGESKAVKEEGGILVTNIDTILVECLYDDLISEIKVDLSLLENINDSIYVVDLKVNEGVNFLTAEDQVIVAVKPMRAEEVVEDTKAEETEKGEETDGKKEDSEKKDKGDSEKTEEKEKKE